MAKICDGCTHLVVPKKVSGREDTLWRRQIPGRLKAALDEEGAEEVRKRQEESLADGIGFAPLDGPPRHLAWCRVKGNPPESYFFQKQQTAEECNLFEARSPSHTIARAGSGKLTPQPEPLWPTSTPFQRSREGKRLKPTRPNDPPGFEVSLGEAATMEIKFAGDSRSQAEDFEVHRDPTGRAPVITGAGFAQTYLIFGGPGAGKTTLFKFLLGRSLNHPSKPGCLVLDPKGAELPAWLARTCHQIGRPSPIRIGPQSDFRFNVFGASIEPRELGTILADVVSAQAGDIDDGWIVLINDLLESATVILGASGPVTPQRLLDAILYRQTMRDPRHPDGKTFVVYPIEVIAAQLERSPTVTRDQRNAIARLREYLTSEERQRRYVRQLVEKCLGDLRKDQWANLSAKDGGDLYASIIHEGLVAIVAVGYANPSFQRSLLTLMKAVFQQYSLAQMGTRPTDAPFYILACDEYAQIVTESTLGLVSDSAFFSQSRQAGCMSLLALQSVATAKSRFGANVRDRWDGILGNVSGRIFMKLNDAETAKLASDLVGTREVTVRVRTDSLSASGPGMSDSYTLVERPAIPSWIFTARLRIFFGLAQGSFDGRTTTNAFIVVDPDAANAI